MTSMTEQVIPWRTYGLDVGDGADNASVPAT